LDTRERELVLARKRAVGEAIGSTGGGRFGTASDSGQITACSGNTLETRLSAFNTAIYFATSGGGRIGRECWDTAVFGTGKHLVFAVVEGLEVKASRCGAGDTIRGTLSSALQVGSTLSGGGRQSGDCDTASLQTRSGSFAALGLGGRVEASRSGAGQSGLHTTRAAAESGRSRRKGESAPLDAGNGGIFTGRDFGDVRTSSSDAIEAALGALEGAFSGSTGGGESWKSDATACHAFDGSVFASHLLRDVQTGILGASDSGRTALGRAAGGSRGRRESESTGLNALGSIGGTGSHLGEVCSGSLDARCTRIGTVYTAAKGCTGGRQSHTATTETGFGSVGTFFLFIHIEPSGN